MLKKFYRCRRVIYSSALILLMAGCTSSWRYPQPPGDGLMQGAALGTASGVIIGSVTGVGAAPGAVVGGLSGSIIAAHLAKHQTLVQKISAAGVQIILMGDNLKLILPTDLFLAQDTPVLNENYYSVLNQIAILLKGLNKYAVKVSGYTDNVASQERNLALSRQQAEVIANYLWSQGIDSRVLYAAGYGADYPIASNSTKAGRLFNRRIEITLREITDGREQ